MACMGMRLALICVVHTACIAALAAHILAQHPHVGPHLDLLLPPLLMLLDDYEVCVCVYVCVCVCCCATKHPHLCVTVVVGCLVNRLFHRNSCV